MADSYDKVRVCDFIGSVNQTLTERSQNLIRLYAELYRDNAANWVQRMRADFSQMRVYCDEALGVATSTFFAGSNGFDGMLMIKPDGKLYVQSGIGNFGSESVSDVHRVAAEILGVPWENVVVTWGNTDRKSTRLNSSHT